MRDPVCTRRLSANIQTPGLGLYQLHRVARHVKLDRERRQHQAISQLPKTASDNPDRFCDDFPALAKVLCRCADLPDAQIRQAIIKTAQVSVDVAADLEKLAQNALGWPGRAYDDASRALQGLLHAGAGGIGTVGGVISEVPGALFGRPLPEGVTRAPTEFRRMMAGHTAAGLKDVAGGVFGLLSGSSGEGSRFYPQAVNRWVRGPQPAQLTLTQQLGEPRRPIPRRFVEQSHQGILDRPGVGAGTQQLSRLSMGAGEVAGEMIPYALIGKAPMPARLGKYVTTVQPGRYAKYIPGPYLTWFAGKGPYPRVLSTVGDTLQAQTDRRVMATPPDLTDLSPDGVSLYNYSLNKYRNEILSNSNIPEGEKQRLLAEAPAEARAMMDHMLKGEQAGQILLDPDAAAKASADELQTAEAGLMSVQDNIQQDPAAANQAFEDITSPDPNTPTDKQNIGKLTGELGSVETALAMYDNMDDVSKFLLWSGLSVGAIGLLSALLSDDKVLPWLLTLLGAGTALGAGIYGTTRDQDPSAEPSAQPPTQPPAQPPAQPLQVSQTTAPEQTAQPAASPEQIWSRLIASDVPDVDQFKQALANPAVRSYVLADPDERLAPFLARHRQNEQIRDYLDTMLEHRGDTEKILTTPLGEHYRPLWWGKSYPGFGMTPREATYLLDYLAANI